MSISDEFSRLQALHENGTLTDAEFSAAKAKILAEGHPQSLEEASTVQQDLRRLQIQNDLLRMDQEWSIEREDYMLRGRYGARYVPTKSNSVGGAIFMSILFLVMAVFGANVPSGEILEWISVFGILFAAGGGIWGCSKARTYEEAEEQYEKQRRMLTDQLAALS